MLFSSGGIKYEWFTSKACGLNEKENIFKKHSLDETR